MNEAGDVVERAVLATLDPTFTRADLYSCGRNRRVTRLLSHGRGGAFGKKYKFSAADPAQSLQGGI